MKVLVYTASALCNPQFGIQMEYAIRYAEDGNEVVFCHCDGVMKACSANPLKNNAFCVACKLGFWAGLKNLPKNINIIGMIDKQPQKEISIKDFKSVAEIKSYTYKGVDLGFSVMSVYISKTRNPNPSFTVDFLNCINKLLWEAEKLVDAADAIISKEKPDVVLFFNGRFFDTKPFHGIAEKYNIDYFTTENIGGIRAGEDYRMMLFGNTIPHNSKILYENCIASWNLSKRTEEEKVKIGESFYEKRRNGQKAGDYVYTSSQVKGKLPKSYEENKKNIVVFTSSEDEFSAVSAQVDSYYLFLSQYECIEFLSNNINDESYHFIVRIHPNMRGLDVEYHRNLYKLQEKENVTVIAPEDDISSYSLIDIAYNVVVFGSTIGAEAMYWGKPVVLMGFAAYYQWGCCSIPQDKKMAIEMVKNPVLYPEARSMAIKYGYYFLENNLAQNARYIKITPKQKILMGRKVYVFDYLKLLGSPLLYRLVSTFTYSFFSNLCKNKLLFPEKIIH